MAPPLEGHHHHRSTTKSANKPFKTKHASKGLIKESAKGKVDERRAKLRKPLHQQVMSKIERRHQARQKQHTKLLSSKKATSIFTGVNGAPRIVAVVPLTRDGDAGNAVRRLNEAAGEDAGGPVHGLLRVRVDRFKQNIQYVAVNRDLLTTLDACRVADYVVFVLSPTEEVDETGEHLLRAIENQGLSTCLTVVQGLDVVEPLKQRTQVLISLKSYISRFLPDQQKVHSLDSLQDCAGVVRQICTTTPRGVKWREDRSWMLIDQVQWPSVDASTVETHGEVVLTGVVRGRGLKADRLVQVGDWGTFQIDKIVSTPAANPKKRKAEEMVVDGAEDVKLLDQPTADQDDLQDLAPEEAVMDDEPYAPSMTQSERKGVLLDDHHYFSDDETHLPPQPKRLPIGTSSYQAAWFLGDVSDSGSDMEDAAVDQDGDLAMSTPALPQDGIEGGITPAAPEPTEIGATEYAESEMFLDPAPADESAAISAFRARRQDEAAEDREFPDEIELEPHVLARERLARYRGLKSLRTSPWATGEDRPHEPREWPRLLQMGDNYRAAKRHALDEALVGGAPPGASVQVHLRSVPLALRHAQRQQHGASAVLALFSLLRHEHKQTAMNYSITLPAAHAEAVRSKDTLVLQCGPRRFVIEPLFSASDTTPNDVHKFARYLHPGTTATASAITPLTWGSVPCLFFRQSAASPPPPPSSSSSSSPAPSTSSTPPPSLTLLATGTSLPPSHSRVIAKRIVLTGHPYKIHKKVVTVRYMFFNADDVRWFKALRLFTKRGRSGYVRESLGTHGYFKANFDGRIDPQDAVGVALWKRVWPGRGALFRAVGGEFGGS